MTGDAKLKEEVEKLVVEDRINSVYHPVVVWMKRGVGKGTEKIGKVREGEMIKRIRWTSEGGKKLERVMRGIEVRRKGIGEEREEIKTRMGKTFDKNVRDEKRKVRKRW